MKPIIVDNEMQMELNRTEKNQLETARKILTKLGLVNSLAASTADIVEGFATAIVIKKGDTDEHTTQT